MKTYEIDNNRDNEQGLSDAEISENQAVNALLFIFYDVL